MPCPARSSLFIPFLCSVSPLLFVSFSLPFAFYFTSTFYCLLHHRFAPILVFYSPLLFPAYNSISLLSFRLFRPPLSTCSSYSFPYFLFLFDCFSSSHVSCLTHPFRSPSITPFPCFLSARSSRLFPSVTALPFPPFRSLSMATLPHTPPALLTPSVPFV